MFTPPNLIARHSLRHPGAGGQAVANAVYLAAARGLARVIGRHGVVRSVYLRRGAAAGEVQLGRSDLDLTIVLHDACATAEGSRRLFELNRTVRGLRRLCPWLGQCEVHAVGELADWAEVESFRVALEVANGVLLYGEPVELPPHPIDRRQAAYRTAFWLEKYLPIALRARRRDNLWKFALEAWLTASLAVGRLATPCLTRAETLAAWRRSPQPVPPPEPGQSIATLWRSLMALLAEVHATLGAPIRPPSQPVACSLVLPPAGTPRRLLVGTVDQLAEGLCHLPEAALPFTPEAFGLYLEYVNPAPYARLPESLLALGFAAPSVEAWRDALRRWSCPILARKPGFGARDFGVGPYHVRYARRIVETLEAGRPRAPGAVPPGARVTGPPPTFRAYYLEEYRVVYADARAARERLESGDAADGANPVRRVTFRTRGSP